MSRAKNADGTWRFLVKLDSDAPAMTPAKAKALGACVVHWQNDAAGVCILGSTNKDMHLTAVDDDDVESAMPDLVQRAYNETEGLSKDDKVRLGQFIQPVDSTSDWSAYDRNWQWALHAMGVTEPAAVQTFPTNRKPQFVLTDTGAAGGVPLEGSGTKIGFYGLESLPGYILDSNGDPLEPDDADFFNPFTKTAILHPAFKAYRDIDPATTPAESVYEEDPAADETDADGGVIGYDILAAQAKVVNVGPADGTDALPANVGATGMDDTKPVTIQTTDAGGDPLEAVAAATTGAITGDVSGAGAVLDFATGAITANGVTWSANTLLGADIFVQYFTPSVSQQVMIDAQIFPAIFASGGAWAIQALGTIASRAVGNDSIPNSAITPNADQLAIRGRMRGLAPRATVINYVELFGWAGGPGTFSASSLIAAIYKAIDHKCQVFCQPWSTVFYNQDALFGSFLTQALRDAKAAGMLVINSLGYYQTDFDRTSFQDEWAIGDTENSVLQVGGTAPRDYVWDHPDLNDFNPTPDTPKGADYNLDRIATTSIFFGDISPVPPLLPLGFGSSQSKELDVVAPMGSIPAVKDVAITTPEDPLNWDNLVITTGPYTGSFDSITYPYDTGFTYTAFCGKGSMAAAHAAGAALLAFEAYKQANAVFPKGKKVFKLLRNKAASDVGPATDFGFITADAASKYAKDPRYTLLFDPATGNGDLFGLPAVQPFGFALIIPAFVTPGTATWYSYEHPADKNRGEDPAYGRGRIWLKKTIDDILGL